MWPFTRKAKAAPAVKRSYAAAGNEARYSDFRRSKGSADYELLNGLSAIREKARALARNSATMGRYIQLMQDNVVGSAGFAFRCRVKKQDRTLDKTLNMRVENAWWEWCKAPTVDGHMTMQDFCLQMVATWCRDGEYFIELVGGSAWRDQIALNPFEADLCDETLNTVHPTTGNQIRMGVEVDTYGRPVAYHLLTQHPGDPGWYFAKSNKRYRRVEADRIIHIFERLRPGQTRGEPPTARIVNSIKMLDGYREAEVTGRRIASAVMGFFKRDLPTASDIDALASEQDDATSDFMMDLEPGTMKSLPPGMSFDKFEASGSQTDYKQFEAQIKRDISMGANISAFSLGMETDGVSYSTARSVLIEDRDYYRRRQVFFIQAIVRIFERWLPMHMLSESSLIPPSRRVAILEAYSFTGRGWDWVDPAKDVKANAEALRTRQTSLSRIAAQRGLDLPDLLQEIADDEAMLKELGLTVTFDKGNNGPQKDGKDAQPISTDGTSP